MSMLICPVCDIVALLSSDNCLKIFPYDDNRTPRCNKCNFIARRYCNICEEKFAYNKPVNDYRKHLQNCINKQLEKEEEIEKERTIKITKEDLKKESEENEIVDRVQKIKLDPLRRKDNKKDLDPFYQEPIKFDLPVKK